jgi:hypothetical protein
MENKDPVLDYFDRGKQAPTGLRRGFLKHSNKILLDSSNKIGFLEIAIHESDVFELDSIGVDSFALTHIRAASEYFLVRLRHHSDDALFALRMTLRQQRQVRNSRRHEERRGGVRTSERLAQLIGI